MMKTWMAILAGTMVALSTIAVADDKPAMDPALAAQFQKYTSPGEHHQVLDRLVGDWTHTVKWRMAPGAKPEVSHGTNENRWIFGNRFIRQDVKGQAMGQPFEGLGLLGYDNVRGEYTSVWLDNMGTGIMTATSTYNPKTKTLSETGSFSCPMTGEKNMAYRAALKIIDNNHYRYEMYMHDKAGKEFKSLEIAYTRVKKKR